MRIGDSISRRKKWLVGGGAALTLLVLLSLLTGDGAEPEVGTLSTTQQPALGADFGLKGVALKVIGSVVLVIVILYASTYAMRRFSGRAMEGRLKQDAISILHKRHIAPKKAIYVVKVGRRAMIIGVTDAQISHLADLTEEELESIRVLEEDKGKQFKKQFLGFALGMKDKG